MDDFNPAAIAKQVPALAKLLGSLNYALLPRASGPAKLFVFHTSATDATKRIAPAKLAAKNTGSDITAMNVKSMTTNAKMTTRYTATCNNDRLGPLAANCAASGPMGVC